MQLLLLLLNFSLFLGHFSMSAASHALSTDFLQQLAKISYDFFQENHHPTLCTGGMHISDDELHSLREFNARSSQLFIKLCPKLAASNVMVLQPISHLLEEIAYFVPQKPHVLWNFVKNDNITYLFDATQILTQELAELFTDESIRRIGCILPQQPYFFILYKNLQLQEFQAFSKSLVPVFDKETNQLIPSNQRRSNFNGQKVRLSVDTITHFRNYNHHHISTLKSALNFSIEVVSFNEYGTFHSNGTWTGMIAGLMQNQIDVSATESGQSANRSQVADPGVTLLKESARIYYWADDTSEQMHATTFLNVFEQKFWYVLAAFTTTSAIYLGFLQTQHKSLEAFLSEFPQSLSVSLRALVSIGYSIKNGKHDLSTAIWTFTMSLSGAVIFWCYNGCLISYLVTDQSTRPFNNFEDLINRPEVKFLVAKSGSFTDRIRNEALENANIAAIYEKNVKPYTLNHYSIEQEMEDKFFNAKDRTNIATVISGHMAAYYSKKHPRLLCHLRWFESKFWPIDTVGWYYPKGSILRPIFDEILIKQKEVGIVDALNERYFREIKSDLCNANVVKPIGYEFVAILFYMASSGAVLSFVVCIMEYFYKATRKN